jgi:hypothetical protein
MATKERRPDFEEEAPLTAAQHAAIARAMREAIHKSNEELRRFVHREAARDAARDAAGRMARMRQSNL